MSSKLFTITAGIIIPLMGVIVAVAVPEARCLTRIDVSQCKTDAIAGLKDVELVIQTDGYKAVSEAEIQLISTGAPERILTDSNGYVKVRIPTTIDVQVIVGKSGFDTQKYSIDLRKETATTRTYRISPIPVVKEKSDLPRLDTEIKIKESSLKPTEPKEAKNTIEQRTEPKNFIQDYFGKINDRKIDQAWNMLSPEFQRGEKGQYSYSSFQEWWGGKVERVIVKNIDVLDQSADSSSVKVKLQYIIKGESVDEQEPLFYVLRWNSESKSWKLHRK